MDETTIAILRWKPATTGEIIIFVCILILPFLIILCIMLYQRYKNIRIKDTQLFLFRLKRLGLSNFQIKIINNLNEILHFTNPNTLLTKPEYFERALGRFLNHARDSEESGDHLCMICKDLAIIYDKLYFPSRPKKHIKSLQDLGEGQLVYFDTENDKVYIGKIVSWDTKHFYLKTFGSVADMQAIQQKKTHTFHAFRLGDAEYSFTSDVVGRDYGELMVNFPTEIRRGGETRHPYIDVIVPAEVSKIGSPEEQAQKIGCTIFKINEYEAVIRVSMKLDHNFLYDLEFTIMDFNFKIISKLIVEKAVEEESGIFYYNLRFNEMSASASGVLKKFVYELL